MKTKKAMASAAKKSARIVKMTAAVSAMCVTMGLSEADTEAAKAAFADMAGEFGGNALIVSMNPFGGLIA